jgi:hypothetical protein
MKEPKFYNKDGTLTAYSFACGYIERKETYSGWKEIYMEYIHYHVRSGPKMANGQTQKWTTWECFDHELTKARKFYRSIRV